ncbi:MAG: hypothetical protein KDG57_22385, partial [Rhodoferax sp.]|nr:hypothetical protein [Rhodoferax sp.]
MNAFTTFVFTPAGLGHADLAIAASRAGAVGIYNAEFDDGTAAARQALARLAQLGRGDIGLKLDAIDDALDSDVALLAARRGGLWMVVDLPLLATHAGVVAGWRQAGVRVLAEVRHATALPAGAEAQIDGLVVKGNEAPGLVGEDASFILLQKWLRATTLPLVLRGGLTPAVAAAIHAVGAAGGVLESQLLLLDEVRLPDLLRQTLGSLSGSETV